MSVTQLKPPKDRRPGPYKPNRRCESCNCILSRLNPGPSCAPCSGGDWHSPLSDRAVKQDRADLFEELRAA